MKATLIATSHTSTVRGFVSPVWFNDLAFPDLTVSFLAFRLGITLPHIIAGENLNMPIVGDALAKCGAVFIRRSFGDDVLYGTMVQGELTPALAAALKARRVYGADTEPGAEPRGVCRGNQAGTGCKATDSADPPRRSRTGKLLPPKYGILSYIAGALLSGRTVSGG
jgi:hypothetical protein